MRSLFLCCMLLVASFLMGKEPFSGSVAFQRAHIGVLLVEKGNPQPLYSRNADLFFVPASVIKVATGVAALAELGENHRFQTDLAYEGAIGSDGILRGNVWVRGGGDPTLSLEMIEEWARALRGHGIKRIDGKVIIDASCCETKMASPYWLFEDLGNYYGAGPSGLTIHRNLYTITFKPGRQLGDPAEVIQIEPFIPGLVFRNEVTTAAEGTGDCVFVFGSEYSLLQYYRGTIPIDQPTFSVKAAIPDPPLLCAQLLSQKLNPTQGFEIIRKKGPVGHLNVIQRYSSPPLKEIVCRMNGTSDNLYAEHLLKAIGKGYGERGAKRMEELLVQKGIPSQVKDGAGLARVNLLSPKGLVDLLLVSREQIYDTLPEIQWVPDLTLRAKTGSMNGICNLAGYYQSASGKEYTFAIFVNNYQGPLSEVRQEIARFLKEFTQEK